MIKTTKKHLKGGDKGLQRSDKKRKMLGQRKEKGKGGGGGGGSNARGKAALRRAAKRTLFGSHCTEENRM